MRTDVLHVDRYPEMRFAAESLDARSGSMSFPLLVTMAGTTRRVPVTAEVTIAPDSIRAVGTFVLKQTDFGIEPYSGGPGGTVKVADKVTFCFDLVGRPGGRTGAGGGAGGSSGGARVRGHAAGEGEGKAADVGSARGLPVPRAERVVHRRGELAQRERLGQGADGAEQLGVPQEAEGRVWSPPEMTMTGNDGSRARSCTSVSIPSDLGMWMSRITTAAPCSRQRLSPSLPVGRGTHLVPLPPQDLRERIADRLLVVDDQDARHAHDPADAGAALKTAPCGMAPPELPWGQAAGRR